MPKLTRANQKVFGDNGDQSHFGQFGSRAGGSGFFTKDPASIQSLSAFIQNGWLDAINSSNKAPFLEDMNGLFFLAFRQLAYLFQEGMPEWDSGTNYFVGSMVKKTGTTEQYGSLVNDNLGNALPNQTSDGFWNFLNPQTVPAGAISDFGGAAAPFGWLLCDGSIKAQASFPALFAAIGTAWNTGGEGGGNFRVPEIRGRASIGAGTGPTLSARTLGQLVGKETHVLTVGEMPAHTHIGSPNPASAQVGTAQATIVGAQPGNFLPVGPSPLSISIGSKGGGAAHDNMQPSAVVLKIIKT